jgi:hypothetical protein
LKFLPVADHTAHLGHAGERFRLHLGGAAGDDHPRLGPAALGAADRLAGLAHRLVGDGAAVDDDQIVLAGRQGTHRLAFGHVEPAAESDDLRPAHRSISPEKT